MTEKNNPDGKIRTIECEEAMRQLFDYLDGEVDKTADSEIQCHLDSCRSCYSRVEFESALKNKVKDAGLDKAPDALRERLEGLIQGFRELEPSDDDQEKQSK